MTAPPPAGPVRRGRLLLWGIPVLALAAAAWLFLPSALVRLAVLAIIALPAAFVLVDRPRWLFAIFIVILFSNIDIFFSIRIFRLVLVFVIAALALAALRGRRIVVHDLLFTALAAAFFLATFQSLAVARDLPAGLALLSKFAKVLVNVAIVVQFTRSRDEFAGFLLVLVAGVAINNFLPIFVAPPTEYQTTSLLWTEGVFRYEGFALEPNEFAMLQIFTIPLVLFLAGRRAAGWLMRIALVVILAGCIFAIVLSFSRGGFASFVFLLACLFVVERRNKWVLGTGVVIFVAAAILAPAVYWSRITSLVAAAGDVNEDFAVVSRLLTMKTALVLGLHSPVFGVGIGNFIAASTRYIPLGLVVHNAPLQIFAECGFPGLGLLAAIVVYNLRVARELSRSGDAERRLLGRMLLVQQLAVFFNALFLPVVYELIFWFMLSMPTIARAALRDGPERSARPAAQPVA